MGLIYFWCIVPDRETLAGLVVRVDITLVQFGKNGQYGSSEAGGEGGGGKLLIH